MRTRAVRQATDEGVYEVGSTPPRLDPRRRRWMYVCGNMDCWHCNKLKSHPYRGSDGRCGLTALDRDSRLRSRVVAVVVEPEILCEAVSLQQP